MVVATVQTTEAVLKDKAKKITVPKNYDEFSIYDSKVDVVEEEPLYESENTSEDEDEIYY